MIALQFVTEAGWSSALIRWFSHGAFSHVDAVLPEYGPHPHLVDIWGNCLLCAQGDLVARPDRLDCKGRDPQAGWLLGARFEGGVAIRPPGYGKFTRRQLVEIPATPLQEQVFYGFLRRQLGKPSDWRAILGFFFARDWREAGQWYCSEVDARGLEIAEVFRYLLAEPANKITPPDLFSLISVLVPLGRTSAAAGAAR